MPMEAQLADDIESAGGGGATVDSLGTSLALERAGSEKADRLLGEQTELIRLQKAQIEEERPLHLSHLRFRGFTDHSKFAFEIAAGLVVLLVVCGLAAMVWNAVRDRDLVVEAFSVPQDLAQTGMTGAVLAGRVLDRFGEMQSETFSLVQGAGSYHRDNPETARVAIPTTGISIGELDRYLRDWLGSETHVTGDIVRTQKGIALTIRYGAQPGATFSGSPADLDSLVQSGAEYLFGAARPLRYVDYLGHKRRYAEANAIIPSLAMQGDEQARSLAYSSWAALELAKGDMNETRDKARIAVELDKENPSAHAYLSAAENNLEHEEGALANLTATLQLARSAKRDLLDPRMRSSLPVFWAVFRDELVGDYSGAIAALTGAASKGLPYYANKHVLDSAYNHDLAEARRVALLIPESRTGRPAFDLPIANLAISIEARNWPSAVQWGARADAAMRKFPDRLWEERRDLWPSWAEAKAHAGDTRGADQLIAETPEDCDDCARKRGRIAAIEHNRSRAAQWFATVSARSPSIPFADTDWGEMLLATGNIDEAIAKFSIASRKGPRFADPLEMWGEALMRKNRSDLAVEKFATAEKLAPNWGRLHLKWGEALCYAGRAEEARSQAAIAARLDLTPGEREELSNVLHAS